MAQLYKFFNSTPTDKRTYEASDFADYFGSVLSTGLLYTDNDAGLEVSAGAGMQTTIANGKAIMQGHMYENTTDETLTHDLPETSHDRYDRVVLRLDMRNDQRNILLHVIKGTASASPQPPELTRSNFIHEISLARVRIRANTSSISANDIYDERLDEDMCGLVNSMLTVPTSQFLAEWQDFMDGITGMTPVPQSEFDAYKADYVPVWHDLILKNNVVEYDSNATPQFCKIGYMVFLRGAVRNVTEDLTTIATFPIECRPSKNHVFAQNTSASDGTAYFARWRVEVGGDIIIEHLNRTHAASRWLPIDTVFVVD